MSMIVAVLLSASGAPAAAPARTAEAVLEAYRAKTSIPRCGSSSEDEIVVCARLSDEFATPLSDPNDDASEHGKSVGRMQDIKDAGSRCKMQGLGCTSGTNGGLNVFAVGKFVVEGIRALLGKDD